MGIYLVFCELGLLSLQVHLLGRVAEEHHERKHNGPVHRRRPQEEEEEKEKECLVSPDNYFPKTIWERYVRRRFHRSQGKTDRQDAISLLSKAMT